MTAMGQGGHSRSLAKLQEHVPSLATNEDLMSLQVVGTSVFESEKEHALGLIDIQASKKKNRSNYLNNMVGSYRLVWFKAQEYEQ